jgi:caffeoyl-CoA O-methyltransferase
MTVYDDDLSRYVTSLFAQSDPVLQQIFDAIPRRGLPSITVKPEEGRFLQFLARACGARAAVEVGALGGYSGVWIARGLPLDGKLITLEKEPRHAQVAREHFALAGVAERVDLRVGDAKRLLPRLAREGPFDFFFMDAEKTDYDGYLDWALANVRRGGIIAAHNAFRYGDILNPGDHSAETECMRRFNQRFAHEPRLLSTIFPAGDGMLIGVVDW